MSKYKTPTKKELYEATRKKQWEEFNKKKLTKCKKEKCKEENPTKVIVWFDLILGSVIGLPIAAAVILFLLTVFIVGWPITIPLTVLFLLSKIM